MVGVETIGTLCGTNRYVHTCVRCGLSTVTDTLKALHGCKTKVCVHLGKAIKRDGVKIFVKSTCMRSKRLYQQNHVSHICTAAENKRSNGKFGRCLPTMKHEFDDDHALEATLYHLCEVNCALRLC